MKWIMFHGLDYILLDCIKKINTTNGQSIRHSSTYMDNPKVTFWGGKGGGKCNYRKCIEYVKLTHDYSLAVINHVDLASVTTKAITIFQIWNGHL